MYQKTLFLHRRDLRVHDNLGLLEALGQSETVVPGFIFDPRQVGKANDYRSQRLISFMCAGLRDLGEQYKKQDGRLQILAGKAESVVEDLIKREKIDAVFVNRDYTPFSKERDARLAAVCKKYEVAFVATHDLLLVGDPDNQDLMTGAGKPYKVFTPFYRNASSNITIPKPLKVHGKKFYGGSMKGADITLLDHYQQHDQFRIPPGRSGARQLLQEATDLTRYQETRDQPSLATSYLSAHNKLGTLSIREIYHVLKGRFGSSHGLVRQLYWRDFFTQLAHHWPHVYQGAFNQQFDAVKWENDQAKFARWCEGTTGFPIVDAGMRELNQTGYMHNRARMIVASFLTKDLHIDWRWGEKYFAQTLLDYDPAVNNGSWQWAAGTGADAAPYFRIFNPWLQQKKFDPECVYIKEWVPELKSVEPTRLHTLPDQGVPEGIDYPEPILDHRKEAQRAKELYTKAVKTK